MPEFSDADLEAYLEEALDPGRAAELEACLTTDRRLIERLSQINGRRDAGVHTLGEIWRQHQIAVPSPEKLRQYVANSLPEGEMDYIHFRLEVLKCRYTSAVLADIRSQLGRDADEATQRRRRKYIDSSAGLLRKRREAD